MSDKHWFNVETDIVSAFDESDYNKLKGKAIFVLNFIKTAEESEFRVRDKIYAVYNEIESIRPGTISKLTGITMGVGVIDGRRAGLDPLLCRYLVYKNVYRKDARRDYFILKNYDKYVDGSKIITVSNGLNQDENSKKIRVLSPVYTYGFFSWYVIEKLVVPFFEFIAATNDYEQFKSNIFIEYVHKGARLLTTFDEDLAKPLLERKPVDLPPEGEKRYQDLINS